MVLASLKSLDNENVNFDSNQEILKNYLLKLGYENEDSNLKKVLQKNTEAHGENKITFETRVQLFNKLDYEAAQIRTNLVFVDFAQKLAALLVSNQFAPVAAPNLNQISSDPFATIKWVEGTKKLIDFIIADWELIQNKQISFNNDELTDLVGMSSEKLGQILTLIFPLKNMEFEQFNARIDSIEKGNQLLSLLTDIASYLDFLKTKFSEREKEINNQLYGKNENIQFNQEYNKIASIKTMHDYLNTVLVSSKKYTKRIDFIFKKFGRLSPQQCIDGKNSYIEQVKPIRELGGLLTVIGLLNTGLSLRGHTLNGMKQSVLELKTYLKNKELKSAAKYVGASFHKKHIFGILLPVGIGLGVYGHYKTDTLRKKRDSFREVITVLEKPYKRDGAE